MTPTEDIPTYTISALEDWIKQVWRQYKDEDNKIAGDFYYDQIISGGLLNQRINLVLEHFPADLRIQLEQFTDRDVSRIIIKAVKELFGYIQGQDLLQKADKENRFHWRFVK